MSTKDKLLERLAVMEKERDELFKDLQENKDNPYWYEDYGIDLKLLDARIERAKSEINAL